MTRNQKAKEAEKLKLNLQEYLQRYVTLGGEENTSIIAEDPDVAAKWTTTVHDGIKFLFERNDESEDRFDKLDGEVTELHKVLGEKAQEIATLGDDYSELRNIISKLRTPTSQDKRRSLLSSTTLPETDEVSDRLAAAAEAGGVTLNVGSEDVQVVQEKCGELLADLENQLFERLSNKFEARLEEIELTHAERAKAQAIVNENLVKSIQVDHERIKRLEIEVKKFQDAIFAVDQDLTEIKKKNKATSSNLEQQVREANQVLISGSTLYKSITLDSTGASVNKNRLKAEPPTFKGEQREKPLRYLNDLKGYVNIMSLDDDEALYQIKQSLEGTARAWFDVAERTISTFDEFEARFRERFWSEAIQDEWSRKVEYQNYNPAQKYSRLEHATHIWGFAQELNCKYSEEELVRKISNHFEWDIRYSVRSQQIKSQAKFFELLSYRDADHEKGKANKTSSSEKNTEKEDQRPQQSQSQAKPQSQTPNRNNPKGAYPKAPNQKSVQTLDKTFVEKKSNGQNQTRSDDSIAAHIDIRALDRKVDEYVNSVNINEKN